MYPPLLWEFSDCYSNFTDFKKSIEAFTFMADFFQAFRSHNYFYFAKKIELIF